MDTVSKALCRVDVYSSCILSTSLNQAWSIARNFGAARWLNEAANANFSVRSTSGSSSTEVGSTRMFGVGSARLFEQLVALDDSEHRLQWVLISHPKTISPFNQASFVNYKANLQLRPVTTSRHTYAEWTGHFYTEPQYVQHMQAIVEQWYLAGFQGLQDCAARQQADHHKSRSSCQSSRATCSGEEMQQAYYRSSHAGGEDAHGNPSTSNPSVTARAQQPGIDVGEAVMDTYLTNQQHYMGRHPAPSLGLHHNKGPAAAPSQSFPPQAPLPPAFQKPKVQQNTFSFPVGAHSPHPKPASRLRHESPAKAGSQGGTTNSSHSSLCNAERQSSSQLSSRTTQSCGLGQGSQLSTISNMSTDDLVLPEGLHAQHELLRQSTLDRSELNHLNKIEPFPTQANAGLPQNLGLSFLHPIQGATAKADHHMLRTTSTDTSDNSSFACSAEASARPHKKLAPEEWIGAGVGPPCPEPHFALRFHEEDGEPQALNDLSQGFTASLNFGPKFGPQGPEASSADDIELEAARLQARAASLHKTNPTFVQSHSFQASPFAWMNAAQSSPFTELEAPQDTERKSQQSNSTSSSLSQDDRDHFRFAHHKVHRVSGN